MTVLSLRWKAFAAAAGVAALAGCTTPAPPPPPPPPPPPVAVVTPEPVPPRPIPPGGAPYVMTVPSRDAAGQRLTVNRNLDPVETLWNFRSGWNVAALNCTDAADARVIDGYSAFLRRFQTALANANSELDRRMRRQFSTSRQAVAAREARMTSVYNYFAQPPARAGFCAAARSISAQMLDAAPSDATAFAAANLPLLEAAFEQFFTEYEQYQMDAAAWDQRYGARYGASQPGYVAVWGTQGQATGVASSLIAGDMMPTSEVRDPTTGAMIPVILNSDGAVTTPVIQPLPGGAQRRR